MRTVEQNKDSIKYELCNTLSEILKYKTQRLRANALQSVKELKAQSIPLPGQQPSLYEPLHSVDKPINYRKLVISDSQCGHQNQSSMAAQALRNIDLSAEKCKTIDMLVVADEPLRLPRTNPFRGRLRIPKLNTDVVPKSEIKSEINDNQF